MATETSENSPKEHSESSDDTKATLQQLKDFVGTFCRDREWDQFHGPKDLAIGLITEAAELLEEFRFKSDAEIAHALADRSQRKKIGDELADCLFFVLRFAQRFDFDLAQGFADKMAQNGKKYPVEKAKGKNLKYNEL